MGATLLVWVAVALSGAAALAYEICWSRALVVPLGNSADAAAVVLAGFMLGIAVGARLGGGLSERVRSPLRTYAVLELLLGAYALVAPKLLASLNGVAVATDGSAVGLGIVVRYLSALVLIVVPGLAMGATLPLLIRALTRPEAPLGLRIGILYGCNTVGAALGAFGVGFFAIATFGLWGSSAWAAAASVAAAAIAVVASRVMGTAGAAAEAGAEAEAEAGAGPDADAAARAGVGVAAPTTDAARAALIATFVSGLSMLACELLWARVLTFVFGHDTYAFASLLAFVLLGLGLGGLVHRLLHRLDQAKLMAALLASFAVVTLLSFWTAAALVVRFGRDPFGLDATGTLATSVWLELYRELCYTPILLLLPAVLAGVAFPTACSLYRSSGADAGRRVGMVGLVNGVGSALGALGAALFLVPLAGIQTGFAWLALACAATSAVTIVMTSSARRLPRMALALVPVALVAAVVEGMPPHLPRQMLLSAVGARHQVLHHYEEARTSTVAVIENQINGERQLLINAVNEVTTRLVHDQSFKVLGHLGPLLHPQPRTGVMICLGAGLSAGAALSHPLEQLDVVDLSSAVARGARWFTPENNGVLDDPRFHLHIDDGRQFLLNSGHRYDLAIVDSTHPKSVDSWILYTREFYDLLHDRLSDGGIAVQWLPLHGLSEREFKIIVRTFVGAFPEATLWANVGFETYGQTAYAKLVGVRGGPLRIDVEQLTRRLATAAVKRDLARYGVDAVDELLDLYIAGPAAIRAWTDGLPEQTDDHPLVPYTTAYATGRPMEARWLLALRAPVTPVLTGAGSAAPELRARLDSAFDAQGLVLAGELSRAAEIRPDGLKIELYRQQLRTTLPYYSALAERYPDDPNKLFEAATQLGNLGHPEAARQVYRRALELRPDDFRLRLNHGLMLLQLGETAAAIDVLARLRRERPGDPLVLRNLGLATLVAGDPAVAIHHLEEALALEPESITARLSLGRARAELGQLDRAEAILRDVVAENRWIAEAHDRLGLVVAERGDHRAAAAHHETARQLAPYRPDYPFHQAAALQAAGDLNGAAQSYTAVLALEPNHKRALHGLGLVHGLAGRLDQAALFQLQALDVDPDFAAAAHHLGLARRRQGQKKEAIRAFCRALRLDPTLTAAQAQLAELDARPASCEH